MMNQARRNAAARSKVELKHALFMGFCAVCILAAKMAFRWNLHISGHSMVFVIFFLIIARGVVPYRFAATFTAAITGAAALMMGMGQGGPFHVLKYVFPGLFLDLSAMAYPRFMYRWIPCIFAAAVASASKFFGNAAVDWFVGMDAAILWQHALLQSAGAIAFGIVGSLLVPPVMRRLEIHGFI